MSHPSITVSTKTPIDPADIRVGDLIERESRTPHEGNACIRRGRVLQISGGRIQIEGHPERPVRPSGLTRVDTVDYFLLDRTPEPDEAERLRIADILDEHVRAGNTASTRLSKAELRQYGRLHSAFDQQGDRAHLTQIAAWLRAGAVVPE